MRPLAAALAALLAGGCAAGPHPLPEAVRAHLEAAGALPDGLAAVGCSPESPCSSQEGVWYPQPLAAHLAGAEACCVEGVRELRKVDRAGLDTLTIVVVAVGAGLAAAAATAAGYEIAARLPR